jgi:beta-lactam-binding protein with PASTA domain
VPRGIVIRQEPAAGERIQRGNAVRYFVSTGRPRVDVPEVVGARESDAVATLRAAGLVPRVVDIFSQEPTGTVIAQDPRGGTSVVEGSDVRINVSKGPQQTGLPDVVGRSFDDASAALREAGFTPVRADVEDDAPEGTVVGMDPAAGTLVPPGTRVTLNVSLGSTATAVPDVVGLDEPNARATLQNGGWRVVVRDTTTGNADEDGIVITQEPGPGEEAEPGSQVVIYVARFTQTETEEQPPAQP